MNRDDTDYMDEGAAPALWIVISLAVFGFLVWLGVAEEGISVQEAAIEVTVIILTIVMGLCGLVIVWAVLAYVIGFARTDFVANAKGWFNR